MRETTSEILNRVAVHEPRDRRGEWKSGDYLRQHCLAYTPKDPDIVREHSSYDIIWIGGAKMNEMEATGATSPIRRIVCMQPDLADAKSQHEYQRVFVVDFCNL